MQPLLMLVSCGQSSDVDRFCAGAQNCPPAFKGRAFTFTFFGVNGNLMDCSALADWNVRVFGCE